MPTDLESKYMRMDDEDLLAIIHSQDFRPDARELAKALLIRRQTPVETIDQWRDPTAKFADPPWAGGRSASQMRQMFKRRRLLDRLIIWSPLGLGAYSLLRSPDLLFFISFFISFWWYYLWYLTVLRPLLYCIFYWRYPLQILLLRPFAFSHSRKLTRRFARNYLRYLGHTYTLSDSEVKPRLAFLETLQFFLPFIVSVWMYWIFRPYFKVNSDNDVRRLKEFISRRFARNMAWVLSWDKLFKISCTAHTWKRTVQHLINGAQLIVVDLSDGGEGLKWELNEVQFYRAAGKVVFVCHEDRLDTARMFLGSHGLLVGSEEVVFAYDNKGVAHRREELIVKLASVAASSAAVNNSLELTA